MEASKSQITKLGERLKKGDISEADLRLLDAYRRSFSESYEFVVGAVRNELALEPTGRPAKSTTSISEKLRRESIRLPQIQDIAGCRLIVSDIAEQEKVVGSLSQLFEDTIIVDRRQKPSHGYRAVHVIVTHLDKMVEIQVRTSLQQLWSELSEKLSDLDDPAIKYGGGDDETKLFLALESLLVSFYEAVETEVAGYKARLSTKDGLNDKERSMMAITQGRLSSIRQHIFEQLRDLIKELESPKGEA